MCCPLFAAGDFNGDGNTDLAMEGGGSVFILLGKGDGTFSFAGNYAAVAGSLWISAIAVGDFNSDGKADILIAYQDQRGLTRGLNILFGNGDGTFSAPFNYADFGAPIAVADFNGDGNPDFAVGTTPGGTNPFMLLGNGDRTTPLPISINISGTATSLVSGDFNGDGKADLAVGGIDSGTNAATTWILLGNGNGTFQLAVSYPFGSAVASGDFNGDGFVDLVVADSSGNMVGILQGKGDGTFQQGLALSAAAPLAVADFNGDGRADILTNGTLLLGTTSASLTLTATGGTLQSARVESQFSFPLQVTVLNNGFPMTGVYINFTAPSSGATAYLPATAITDASGVASVTPQTNAVPGTYTVTASYQGVTATFSLTNTAVPATIIASTPNLTFSAQAGGTTTAQNVTLSTTSTTPPAISGASFDVSWLQGNVISGSLANLTSTSPAVLSITANAGNLTNGTYTGHFTITPSIGSATVVTITFVVGIGSGGGGSTGTITASQTSFSFAYPSSTLVASLTVGSSNPGVTSFNVTISSQSNWLLFDGVSGGPYTGVGLGSFNLTVDQTVVAALASGTYTGSIVLSNPQNSNDKTTVSATLTVGPAGSVTASPALQSTVLSTAFSTPLQVVVKDPSGSLVSGVVVTFTAPTNGPSAVLSAGTAVTNASGVASVTAMANNISGSYTVTVSALVLWWPLTATFSLGNMSASPASIMPTFGSPQSVTLGTAFSNALQATVKDSAGNPVNGAIVTFAVPTTGASATLSSVTAVTNSSGVASVTAMANNILGGYNVTASVSGFEGAGNGLGDRGFFTAGSLHSTAGRRALRPVPAC